MKGKVMEEVEKKIEELKTLMDKNDVASATRRDEIALWLKAHRAPEVEQAFHDFVEESLSSIASEVNDIRFQLEQGHAFHIA